MSPKTSSKKKCKRNNLRTAIISSSSTQQSPDAVDTEPVRKGLAVLHPILDLIEKLEESIGQLQLDEVPEDLDIISLLEYPIQRLLKIKSSLERYKGHQDQKTEHLIKSGEDAQRLEQLGKLPKQNPSFVYYPSPENNNGQVYKIPESDTPSSDNPIKSDPPLSKLFPKRTIFPLNTIEYFFANEKELVLDIWKHCRRDLCLSPLGREFVTYCKLEEKLPKGLPKQDLPFVESQEKMEIFNIPVVHEGIKGTDQKNGSIKSTEDNFSDTSIPDEEAEWFLPPGMSKESAAERCFIFGKNNEPTRTPAPDYFLDEDESFSDDSISELLDSIHILAGTVTNPEIAEEKCFILDKNNRNPPTSSGLIPRCTIFPLDTIEYFFAKEKDLVLDIWKHCRRDLCLSPLGRQFVKYCKPAVEEKPPRELPKKDLHIPVVCKKDISQTRKETVQKNGSVKSTEDNFLDTSIPVEEAEWFLPPGMSKESAEEKCFIFDKNNRNPPTLSGLIPRCTIFPLDTIEYFFAKEKDLVLDIWKHCRRDLCLSPLGRQFVKYCKPAVEEKLPRELPKKDLHIPVLGKKDILQTRKETVQKNVSVKSTEDTFLATSIAVEAAELVLPTGMSKESAEEKYFIFDKNNRNSPTLSGLIPRCTIFPLDTIEYFFAKEKDLVLDIWKHCRRDLCLSPLGREFVKHCKPAVKDQVSKEVANTQPKPNFGGCLRPPPGFPAKPLHKPPLINNVVPVALPTIPNLSQNLQTLPESKRSIANSKKSIATSGSTLPTIPEEREEFAFPTAEKGKIPETESVNTASKELVTGKSFYVPNILSQQGMDTFNVEVADGENSPQTSKDTVQKKGSVKSTEGNFFDTSIPVEEAEWFLPPGMSKESAEERCFIFDKNNRDPPISKDTVQKKGSVTSLVDNFLDTSIPVEEAEWFLPPGMSKESAEERCFIFGKNNEPTRTPAPDYFLDEDEFFSDDSVSELLDSIDILAGNVTDPEIAHKIWDRKTSQGLEYDSDDHTLLDMELDSVSTLTNEPPTDHNSDCGGDISYLQLYLPVMDEDYHKSIKELKKSKEMCMFAITRGFDNDSELQLMVVANNTTIYIYDIIRYKQKRLPEELRVLLQDSRLQKIMFDAQFMVHYFEEHYRLKINNIYDIKAAAVVRAFRLHKVRSSDNVVSTMATIFPHLKDLVPNISELRKTKWFARPVKRSTINTLGSLCVFAKKFKDVVDDLIRLPPDSDSE